MNSKQTILLETSIQLERMIGMIAEQRAIEGHLATAECHFISSAYVFMEFQRAVLADYVRVYHAIQRYKNWNDIAHALRSGVLSYRPRTLGRCLHILTYAMPSPRLFGRPPDRSTNHCRLPDRPSASCKRTSQAGTAGAHGNR